MEIQTDYIYKVLDLCEALNINRRTIWMWERAGKLTCPRSIGNFRIFTKKQIREIVDAFSPGGKGYWHFKS